MAINILLLIILEHVFNYQSVINANTNYGYRAGQYAATGGSNSFYGYNAGSSITGGTNISAIW